MSRLYASALRGAKLNAVELAVGTAPLIRFYSGTMPANADAPLAGNVLLAEGTSTNPDWLSNPSGAGPAKQVQNIWSVTGQSGAGSGTIATFYRIYDSTGTTCHLQGTCGVSVRAALTAAAPNGSVALSVASTTGIVAGMKVDGILGGDIAEFGAVPFGTRVLSTDPTTVWLTRPTIGFPRAIGYKFNFAYDIEMNNASIANGQVCQCQTLDWSLTALFS